MRSLVVLLSWDLVRRILFLKNIGSKLKVMLFHFIGSELWACCLGRFPLESCITWMLLKRPSSFARQVPKSTSVVDQLTYQECWEERAMYWGRTTEMKHMFPGTGRQKFWWWTDWVLGRIMRKGKRNAAWDGRKTCWWGLPRPANREEFSSRHIWPSKGFLATRYRRFGCDEAEWLLSGD